MAFAATPEIRSLLESYGGEPTQDDDEVVKSLVADPNDIGIGMAFTMSAERPDMLALRSARAFACRPCTCCQGYLLKPDALRTLPAHGMSPDQMNWPHQTLLHHASTRDTSECAAILLDAGATITARDDEYRSTPLAWAARANKPKMVEFLLSRGAPVNLPDDEPWATPLAWAVRRGQPADCLDSSGS